MLCRHQSPRHGPNGHRRPEDRASVRLIDQGEEDGRHGADQDPVEGRHAVADEAPRVEAHDELGEAGQEAAEEAAEADRPVGEEEGREDDGPEDGIVDEGRLNVRTCRKGCKLVNSRQSAACHCIGYICIGYGVIQLYRRVCITYRRYIRAIQPYYIN